MEYLKKLNQPMLMRMGEKKKCATPGGDLQSLNLSIYEGGDLAIV